MPRRLNAGERRIASPDGRLEVVVSDDGGRATYSVTYDGEVFLKPSPLGLRTNVGDFTQGLTLGEESETTAVDETYSLKNIKKSTVHYVANRVRVPFEKEGKTVFDVEFSVGNNDVAFPLQSPPCGRATLLCCGERGDGIPHGRRYDDIPLPAERRHGRLRPYHPEL